MSSKHHIEEIVQNFKEIDFLSFTESHLTTGDSTLTDIKGCRFAQPLWRACINREM